MKPNQAKAQRGPLSIKLAGKYFTTETAQEFLAWSAIHLTVQALTAAARAKRIKAVYVGVWLFEKSDIEAFARSRK